MHNAREWNLCPAGHGPRLGIGRVRASSQYIVELGQDRLTPGAQDYSDVIEVVDSDYVAYHAGVVNSNSIGIEIPNVGWGWARARHDAMTGAGAAQRPVDQNRWLHLSNAVIRRLRTNCNLMHNDFQAYQEEQYLALLLLLRYLCIKHRIARRFLGETTHEKMKRWWNDLPGATEAITRSKLMRFRGIFSHMNCHEDKECGGPALHRNRLFRGIIDEWWMPVQLDGNERPYYMGPFDPQPSVPSYFRWNSGTLHAELFHDADLDLLQETKSYYDLDKIEWYYANTETAREGGTFPVGTNRIWHDGVHFAPPDSNCKVYAAASGTIVAARLGGDSSVENDPGYGSQRFALIRHTVYYQQEADPDGGTRINYTNDPTYFFSLYMHLAPVADIASVDNNNPPWFNYWRRRNAGADANGVFCPNVEVSVGDWIGECGKFQGRRMIHFQVMSREELTVGPWNDARYRFHDPDTNIMCDSANLDSLVRDAAGDGIDTLDILRAARHLRNVKSYHKSEWALTLEDHLAPIIPSILRMFTWSSIKHFMWIPDAVKVYPNLSTELCDANGFCWHYHPITFMNFINRLILEENSEISELDMRNINVVMQGGYLTRYVRRRGSRLVPAQADNQRIRPYDISNSAFEYRFSRAELACQGAGAHNPGPAPPNATKFSLALLNVLESVRRKYNSGITVNLSHLCSAHSADTPANLARCVIGTVAALRKHANGLAVDITPSSRNRANCIRLWNAAGDVINEYNSSIEDYSGEASRDDLPAGTREITVSPMPAAGAFNIHIELVAETQTIVWECWIRRSSKATGVKLHNSGIIGVFNSQPEADAEKERDSSWPKGALWECWIRRSSKATEVKLHDSDIIGVFSSRDEAEAEKATGYAWPKEK